jgi:uncharacterized membrane-anchored protein YjiN (DUF445 family)
MKKAERAKLVERIMEDISQNISGYEKFVLDCVRDRVEHWEDDELKNWVINIRFGLCKG